ncbi:hypothetical protein [Streptomyces alboniger]|uniref:hypothetical protein n=1 Tax=Streptomyces alboniger TaxID=132473 RepID=UPI00123C8076|nr:hypothetical protein [Streptomyces alboniger]
MSWGNARGSVKGYAKGNAPRGGGGSDWGAWGGSRLRAAAAASAAQLPVAGAVAFTLSIDDDSYGAGGPALGLACFLLFGPLLLPVVGLLHSAALTLPASWLGRTIAARLGRAPAVNREWAWSLVCLLPAGAAWAACLAALGTSFAGPALWIAASGVLPVLNTAYCRRREERLGRPLRKVWLLSGLASLGLSVTVIGAALVGTATGLIKEYEPPQLSVEQLSGVWRGERDEGAVLRLREGGGAELDSIPYEGGTGSSYDSSGARERRPRCDGTGTWTVGNAPYGGRPAVVLEAEGCGGHEQTWTVGGTESRPELFVLFGDPDSQDIEKLVREGG